MYSIDIFEDVMKKRKEATLRLIDELYREGNVPWKVRSEVCLKLRHIQWLEGVCKYYIRENQRLERALARAEENYFDLKSRVRAKGEL